jgi:hypothetical protein
LSPAKDVLHTVGIEHPADQARRQQTRRLAVERPDRQLLQPRGVESPVRLVARRQDHSDGRAGEPPAREQQRVERGRVQPNRVVHARKHRPLGRREQEQPEDGGAHEEAVALDGRRHQPERASQRRPLRTWQLRKEIQHRPQHLEDTGERELGLAGDPAAAQHGDAFSALRCEVQQGGFAGAWDAPQHQCGAVARSRRVDQRLKARTFGVPAHEHAASVTPDSSSVGWNCRVAMDARRTAADVASGHAPHARHSASPRPMAGPRQPSPRRRTRGGHRRRGCGDLVLGTSQSNR